MNIFDQTKILYCIEEENYLRVIFNQPEKKNPFDARLASIFGEFLDHVSRLEPQVVVFEGSERVFCAGGDFNFLEQRMQDTLDENMQTMEEFYISFLKVRNLQAITIARVEGAAIGAGLCFAMACDFRFVHRDAKLALNFVRLGLNPGMGAWPLASSLLGSARAKKLLFFGERFTAEEFYQWGGADFLFSTEEEANKEISEYVRCSLKSSAFARFMLKREICEGRDFHHCLSLEAEGQAACYHHPEFEEGLSCAKEKRNPDFLKFRSEPVKDDFS